MFTFETANTVYAIEVIGFGLMEVTRTPKGERDALAGHRDQDGLVFDEVLVVPPTPDAHILEERVVVFRKDGKAVLRTSYTGSDTYNRLDWGTYEDGRFPYERVVPSHLPVRQVETPQDRIVGHIERAFGVR